jgi:hypothetical protein
MSSLEYVSLSAVTILGVLVWILVGLGAAVLAREVTSPARAPWPGVRCANGKCSASQFERVGWIIDRTWVAQPPNRADEAAQRASRCPPVEGDPRVVGAFVCRCADVYFTTPRDSMGGARMLRLTREGSVVPMARRTAWGRWQPVPAPPLPPMRPL